MLDTLKKNTANRQSLGLVHDILILLRNAEVYSSFLHISVALSNSNSGRESGSRISTGNLLCSRNKHESFCEKERCLQVQHVVNKTDMFESNTVLSFLPGDHNISIPGELIINNATDVTLTGYYNTSSSNTNHNPSIVCYREFGVLFVKVNSVTVSNITFINCGIFPIKVNYALFSTTTPLKYSLSIMVSGFASIQRVIVSNGSGVGLRILDVYGDIMIGNSLLTANEINCLIEITNDYYFDPITTDPKASVIIANTGFTRGKVGQEPIKLLNRPLYSTGLTIKTYQSTYTTITNLTNISLSDNSGSKGNLLIYFAGCGSNVTIFNISSKKNSEVEQEGHDDYGGYFGLFGADFCDVFRTVRVMLEIINGHFEKSCMKIVKDFSVTILGNDFDFEIRLSNVHIEKTSCTSLHIDHIKTIQLQDVKITRSVRAPALEVVSSKVTLEGKCKFYKNTGGIILYEFTYLVLEVNSDTMITENTIMLSRTNRAQHIYGTPLYALKSGIDVRNNAHLMVDRNNAVLSGGITLVNSNISFNGFAELLFIQNQGSNGGGLAMYSSYLTFISSNASLQFIGNRVQQKGGGIYVDDTEYVMTASNTVPLAIIYSYNSTPTIYFRNNSANLAGSDLYGGWIDWVMLLISESPYRMPIFRPFSCYPCEIDSNISSLFDFNADAQNDLSLVASNPTRVCTCHNSIPQCSETEKHVSVFIGQAFTIPVVAVGQRLGTAPAIIQAQFESSTFNETTVASMASLADGEAAQIVTKYCTNLTFTVISMNTKEKLLLTTDSTHIPTLDAHLQENFPNYAILYKQFSINIQLKNCSLGFFYSGQTQRCECDPIFDRFGIQCDTQSFHITKPAQMWVNATFSHLRETQTSGVLVHEHCPYDYCNTATDSVTLNLSLPDLQCNYNRSGILCGACGEHLSHVFGSSNCRQCSNWWILLIPVFGVVGVVLVFVLIRLDLTVAIGTINGLIFYANMVQANREIFFPPDKPNSLLNVFIAWINLDIGMEVCFYNELNAYAKTWLQLLFPLYIWILVITIIMSSRYSTRAARLSGTNAVQVLATLFLLSYTKLLRFIIAVFSPTILTYPNSHVQLVWLNDGNVDYFRGKHIPLFLTALSIMTLLSVPYTAVLLFIQWLQRCPNYKILFWVRKLKPLFDAYTGPYKVDHRYWTGLLLLVRVLLLIVFSANIFGDPAINLLAILVIVTILLGYLAQIGGVYDSKIINLIEIFFLTNLNILSATTLLNIETEGNQKSIAVIISTSLSLIVFAIIALCHAFVTIVPSRKREKLEQWIKNKLKPMKRMTVDRIIPPLQTAQNTHVTHSAIQLREPLLKEE